MIKSLGVYTVAFAILFLGVQFSQDYILKQLNVSVRFHLWDTNLFFAMASLIICIHFEFFSFIKKIIPQLGFIYLPTLFIKGAIFFMAFRSTIFNLETLTTTERLNLLIPLLLFLGLEVFFVVKIIRKSQG